jgi:SulP family sulfate permease
MQQFIPMFFTTLKGYRVKQFVRGLTAGVIVAIIALPLSIALALASGVRPEKGLYTAIIAGFVISFLGGSTVQIAGPTLPLPLLWRALWQKTASAVWPWLPFLPGFCCC